MQVTLDGLGHRFGLKPWIFRGLSATFLPGDVYGLVGPSGSGKSSLLHLIAGWEKPTEGVVTLREVSKVNWVFQNPHGSPKRSILDHVLLPLLASGKSSEESMHTAQEMLSGFGLGAQANATFADLSGGEAQRLMLVRALASTPDLLLIDEPTAQLDRSTARSVNEQVQNLATSGLIVILATHDRDTQDACTHIIDLENY